METFVAAHAVHRHSLTIPRGVPGSLELFTPQGERAWAEGWDPLWLWPADGATRAGMVFTTDHGGEHTIWTMSRHEPGEGWVQYVRTTPGSRVGVVTVRCSAAGSTSTRVEVTYEITALTQAGNAFLEDLTAEKFVGFIDTWREAIARL
jgi:hypothetical protein